MAGSSPARHQRTSSAESGAATDTTLVGRNALTPDEDTGTVGLEATSPSPSPIPRTLKRAASVADLQVQTAKRGRVTTETASGSPALNTTATNTAGLPTAAAPTDISIFTATALAVADNTTRALEGLDEVPKADNCGDTTPHSASASADVTAAAAAGRGGAAVAGHCNSPASQSGLVTGANHDAVSVVAPGAADRPTGASTASASDAMIPASATTGFHPSSLQSAAVAAAVPGAAISLDDDEWLSCSSDDDSEWSEPCTDDLDADEVEAALAVPPPSAGALRHMPSGAPVQSPAAIAALSLLTATVSYGKPDEDPAVERVIVSQFRQIQYRLIDAYQGRIALRNGYPASQPPPPESADSENLELGIAERNAALEASLLPYVDVEGIEDDGFNCEDPDFRLEDLYEPRRRHFL
ncbi:hypothetical protein AURDEDRAFT_124180 [Auricularia subglabra TFB-10046 SS5]|nr:hypothetical protein AURDEDRAFT_124180 [Auricularia subglabra TFB-10046 SS5]